MHADERKVRFHIERLEERIAPVNVRIVGLKTSEPTQGLNMADSHTGGVVSWTAPTLTITPAGISHP
jgi:hypothetical protein